MSKYLANLTVMYAKHEYSQPDETASELQGDSSDINSGFGGKFVWLRPEWTSVRDEAISTLSFQNSAAEIRNYNNLALGTQGDGYRYILVDRNGGQKITKIGLFCTAHQLSPDQIEARIQQSGYTDYSMDVNKGRGGDYLYVVWAHHIQPRNWFNKLLCH